MVAMANHKKMAYHDGSVMGIGLHGYLWTPKKRLQVLAFPDPPGKRSGPPEIFHGRCVTTRFIQQEFEESLRLRKEYPVEISQSYWTLPLDIVENAFQIFQRQVYQRVRTNIFTSQGKGSPFRMRASPVLRMTRQILAHKTCGWTCGISEADTEFHTNQWMLITQNYRLVGNFKHGYPPSHRKLTWLLKAISVCAFCFIHGHSIRQKQLSFCRVEIHHFLVPFSEGRGCSACSHENEISGTTQHQEDPAPWPIWSNHAILVQS